MQTIEIPLSTRKIRAELYGSEKSEKQPGILFLPDIAGVIDSLRESADLLSKEGYLVVVPDLYSETGAIRYCMRMLFDEACRDNHSDNEHLAEVHEMVDHLKQMQGVDSDKIGVMGQCLTGGFALQMATRSDVAAPVVFHHSFGMKGSGMPPEDAAKVCRNVQGHFGGLDFLLTPHARVEKLKEQLQEKLEDKHYPTLPHGIPYFFRLTGEGREAWSNMLRFFKLHLSA